jgi:hypothetical protein
MMVSPEKPRPNKDVRAVGKRRWCLAPLHVLGEIVDVLQWAIERETPPPYTRDSWRHIPNWREVYGDAILRHLTAWQGGQDFDPESGRLHVSHIGASVFILIARSLETPLDLRRREERTEYRP